MENSSKQLGGKHCKTPSQDSKRLREPDMSRGRNNLNNLLLSEIRAIFSTGTEYASDVSSAIEVPNERRKRKTKPPSGTSTPRPIELKLISTERKPKTEISEAGGVLKLPGVKLKFPADSVSSKREIYLAQIRRQKKRRADQNVTFLTDSLHLWIDESSSLDLFTFKLPVIVQLAKHNPSVSSDVMIQRTASIKDIEWTFFKKLENCMGDFAIFETKLLGGYRAITTKSNTMIGLHYHLCVSRPTSTDDPDQHRFIAKFFTENKEKSVLAELKTSNYMECLLSEFIEVPCCTSLQLSLSGNVIAGNDTELVLNETKTIKRNVALLLCRPPTNFNPSDLLRLTLEVSSPLMCTRTSQFHFQWKKKMRSIPYSLHVNVNGDHATGIQQNVMLAKDAR